MSWTNQLHYDVKSSATAVVERDFTPPVTPTTYITCNTGLIDIMSCDTVLTYTICNTGLSVTTDRCLDKNHHLKLNFDTTTFIMMSCSRCEPILISTSIIRDCHRSWTHSLQKSLSLTCRHSSVVINYTSTLITVRGYVITRYILDECYTPGT